MPCDQIGKLFMALVLITVSSLLNFCFETHINHFLFIFNCSQKGMSIIVIETLGVFESLRQLAHKKIRYHPRCFSYRNLHITPPP